MSGAIRLQILARIRIGGGVGPSLSFFSRRNPMAKDLLLCDHQVDKLVNEKGLAVSDRG